MHHIYKYFYVQFQFIFSLYHYTVEPHFKTATLGEMDCGRLRYLYNPFDHPRAVRSSALGQKPHINRIFFGSLITTDYDPICLNGKISTVFRKCEYFYKASRGRNNNKPITGTLIAGRFIGGRLKGCDYI